MGRADIYTKAVLTVIALALSVVALSPYFSPKTVVAANAEWRSSSIQTSIHSIGLDVSKIASGSCRNKKFAGQRPI